MFDPEHHDLGTIYASTPAPTRTIRTTIKNEGDQPATILAVMPSCLCTTESLSTRQIAPHSAAELTLTVRLGDSPEPRRTLIQVRSDDPHRPEVPMTVNWQVRPALATEPITLYWGDLQPGERRQAKLAICTTEIGLCERCELISLTDLGEISHQIKLEPMTNASHGDPAQLRGGRHKVGELHVELRCPFEVTTQQTSLDLLLKCRNEIRARLAIPVSWSVVPLLQIVPQRLSLGAQPANTLVPAKIVIRSPRGTAFTIRKVRDETDRVGLSLTLPAEARSTQSLAFEIRTPSTQGPWSTRLTVSTDLLGAETLVLPVSGYTPD